MTEIVRRVGEVSAAQVRAYLERKQWFLDDTLRSVATVWHRQQELDAEVMLPLESARDYRQRLKEALASVAAFEQRPILEVISDVASLFTNVISVRVIHADTTQGTIPINDGVLLITKAKDLLLAAAMSLGAKKKQFKGAPAKEASEYVETLLLGQTEQGSYVVNVIAPLPAEQPTLDPQIENYSLAQAVTANLVAGLDALARATTKYEPGGLLTQFDEAVIQGASANLCDALLGFSGSERNRSFEIKITAEDSPLLPATPRTFSFGPSSIYALAKATEYYKEDYILPSRTLIGFIRKLSRKKNDATGTAVLQTTVGDTERYVKVELTENDYHLAVIAHDGTKLVTCSGDVQIKSRSAVLLNPRNFGMLTAEDLFPPPLG